MDSQGSYSAKNHPGEPLIQQAKRLAELPEFQRPGVSTAHFDWDRDLIVFYSEDLTAAGELPLRQTLEQYKDRL